MKLTKNQLKILRKVHRKGDNLANYQVLRKLRKKGLIRQFIGAESFITTPGGYKVLRNAYGQNNF